MVNNTMPERIYAGKILGSVRFELAPHKLEGVDAEYVRADLVQGDASEPLANGQWRWVKVSPDSPWQILYVAPEEDDFYRTVLCMHDSDGFFWNNSEVNAIGPVIRPPEDI